METFNQLWQLFASRGALASQYNDAEQLWASYNTDQQQQIYNAIRNKIEQGIFVHYNPSQAIRENARTRHLAQPTNYYGRALPRGVTFYKAVYNGEVGLYSEQDVKAHKMQNAEMFVSA